MTTQFLFFLSDVALWLLMGYFLGRVLDITEAVKRKKRGLNSMLLISAAFVSGCWSVLTRGLPDHTVSLHSIFMVGVTLFGIALIKGPHFREIVITQATFLLHAVRTSNYFSIASHQLERIKSIHLPL